MTVKWGCDDERLREEKLLLGMIHNSKDQEKAVEVAVKVILDFLAQLQSFGVPFPCPLGEQDETA